jgi:hypothetical protein
VLLKVVLYGYYKGLISSRRLAEACQRNVVFMALSVVAFRPGVLGRLPPAAEPQNRYVAPNGQRGGFDEH